MFGKTGCFAETTNMLPISKIDDGSLKICKVEISRSRRETESVEKTSRVVGGTNIKEGFLIFCLRFKNLLYRSQSTGL